MEDLPNRNRHVLPIPVYCTSGTQRSDGICTMLQYRVLNLVEQNGERRFNCNVFRITDCYNPKEIADFATTWVANPLDVLAGDDNFGRVLVPPLAVEVWNQIGELRTHSDIAMPSATPPPPVARNKRPLTDNTLAKQLLADIKSKAPRTSSSVAAATNDTPRAEAEEDDQGTCFNARVAWSGNWTQRPTVGRSCQVSRVCTRCSMQTVWMHVRCIGDEGIAGVRGIMVNLFKNWDWINNPSAFVAGACIKYRRQRE